MVLDFFKQNLACAKFSEAAGCPTANPHPAKPITSLLKQPVPDFLETIK